MRVLRSASKPKTKEGRGAQGPPSTTLRATFGTHPAESQAADASPARGIAAVINPKATTDAAMILRITKWGAVRAVLVATYTNTAERRACARPSPDQEWTRRNVVVGSSYNGWRGAQRPAMPCRRPWMPAILERHYVSCAGEPKLLYRAGADPNPRGGGRPEESHRRTGPGRWIDRSADHSCRYCIGLLRRGGLCSERDAQRRRGHALRPSTAVRLWPGLQLLGTLRRHDGAWLPAGSLVGLREVALPCDAINESAQDHGIPLFCAQINGALRWANRADTPGAAAVYQRGIRMSLLAYLLKCTMGLEFPKHVARQRF